MDEAGMARTRERDRDSKNAEVGKRDLEMNG